MPLSADFLRQARELATRRGRPSQINLRRATSAAYYALFHLLIGETIRCMVPADPPALRTKASRALQHGEMKEVCTKFRAPLLPKKLEAVLGGQVSPSLREVARAFVWLQEERHAADYDISLVLTQAAALSAVVTAETAFRLWQSIRTTDEANVFLAALVFDKRWDR